MDMENVPPKLQRLLDQYHMMWHRQLGLMKATKHRIDWKLGVAPIRQKLYREGPRLRVLVKEKIARMEARDVLEACNAEWASPVMTVPKPHGTSRFCIVSSTRARCRSAGHLRVVRDKPSVHVTHAQQASKVLLGPGLSLPSAREVLLVDP